MQEKYAKISIDDIPEFFRSKPFDIYLKLGSAKFIKIINSDDESFEETLEDYHSRGVNYLYCDSETYDELLESIESKVDSGLSSAESSEKLEDRYEGLDNALNGIKGMIHNLGLTASVQRKAESLVNLTLKEAEKETKLEILLELLEQKSGFISKQGFLTSFIVIAMVEEMDWATTPLKTKLVTASLFQNIALETDAQAKVYTLDSPEASGLDDYAKELILKHPNLGADLVQAPGFGGEEVQKLIKNHHEIPNEGGFPGRVTAHNIPILDASFIIAGYYSTLVLIREENNEDYSITAQTLNEDFAVGGFKRAFTALLKAISNK
ncbi:MAG: hypothetical protein NXH75_01155 [Halobacteriovoraceae bacterium]|nr:hypothetical protein [Halobacteriovoraceae bacterium]